LASGQKPDGTYERVWFGEPITPDEVSFESGVFLLTKKKAGELTACQPRIIPLEPPTTPGPEPPVSPPIPEPETGKKTRTFHICGDVPPEIWNRLGTKILPKLRSGSELKIGVEFTVTVEAAFAQHFESELRQILEDLGLSTRVRIDLHN